MFEIVTTPSAEEIKSALATTNEIALVSSKGTIIGKRFVFNLGDTKAMKLEIARQNPTWSKTKVNNHLSVIRRDSLSASRLEAAAFVEYQYANGNVAVQGDHKHTGKSVLRFEKAVVKEAKPVDEKAITAKLAANLAAATGMTSKRP